MSIQYTPLCSLSTVSNPWWLSVESCQNSLAVSNLQLADSLEDGCSLNSTFLFRKAIVQAIPVQEKPLGYVLGERVVGPFIEGTQAIISGIFAVATRIDQALSFPVTAAEKIKEKNLELADLCVEDELIESTYDVHDLMDEIRKAHLEFVLAKFLKQKEKSSLIEKLFNPTEIDIINNGPIIRRNVKTSELTSRHFFGGMFDLGWSINKWAKKHDYAGAFPAFDPSYAYPFSKMVLSLESGNFKIPEFVSIYLFKKEAMFSQDLSSSTFPSGRRIVTYGDLYSWAKLYGHTVGIPTFDHKNPLTSVLLLKEGIDNLSHDKPQDTTKNWKQLFRTLDGIGGWLLLSETPDDPDDPISPSSTSSFPSFKDIKLDLGGYDKLFSG